MDLAETIADIPLIDNHAHALEPLDGETLKQRYPTYFTEGRLSREHAEHTMNYRAAFDVLRSHFSGESPVELLDARARTDHRAFARTLLAETNTDVILVDDGYPAGVSVDWFADYAAVDVRPLLRIEPILEELIGDHETFDAVVSAFHDRIETAMSGSYVGLKTIVAYRSGLDVDTPTTQSAREAFNSLSTDWDGRLESAVLLDYFVNLACEAAVEYDYPIQFHTGFGDPDAHPRYVDPTYLYELIGRHPTTKFVLLHAGYPYVRQAGYVVSSFDNVYLDLSLAVPFIQHGCSQLLREVLELTPTTKLLYGSDAFSIPELYTMGADRMRAALETVLDALVTQGHLSEGYAIETAKRILRENAIQLYGLE